MASPRHAGDIKSGTWQVVLDEQLTLIEPFVEQNSNDVRNKMYSIRIDFTCLKVVKETKETREIERTKPVYFSSRPGVVVGVPSDSGTVLVTTNTVINLFQTTVVNIGSGWTGE